MGKTKAITFSAPGKVHLLGEHAVVYGKPALLATVDLRVFVTISKGTNMHPLKKIVDPIVKKFLKLKKLPSYQVNILSQLPIGAGLGSSAATSAAYLAALLSFYRVDLDLELINKLTYAAEKVFHGNPSGADNAAVIFGGLIWFRKETEDLKIIQPVNFKFPRSKNFVLINTGTPKETTKDMVEKVSAKCKVQSAKFRKIFDNQEQLTKKLLSAIQQANEKELIRIIKEGEKNLESIGVVSKQVASIIRKIENAGGAAKICGAGGKIGPTGVLLCYHPNPKIIEKIAKSYNLEYFRANLGTEGLRHEK